MPCATHARRHQASCRPCRLASAADARRRRQRARAGLHQPSRPAAEVLAHGRQRGLAPALAARITDLYDALSTVDGPSAAARALAARHGWPQPEAWTEATIDQPDASPYSWRQELAGDVDEVAVQRVLSG